MTDPFLNGCPMRVCPRIGGRARVGQDVPPIREPPEGQTLPDQDQPAIISIIVEQPKV